MPNYYVRKLCEPIYESGRSVTTDHWFSSLETFNKMGGKNIPMVGTIRKNKRELPTSFMATASVNTTTFAYDGKNVLVSFCPKKNKVIICFSSLHKNGRISPESNKPEIIEFYNKTKSGTDVFDFLCGTFSYARKTRRWTMRFFMGMLDQASVNACILFNFAATTAQTKDRRDFLKSLIRSLTLPQLRDKLKLTNIPRKTVTQIREILNELLDEMVSSGKLAKRKRCGECTSEQDRKTLHCCVRCQLLLCDDHRKSLCSRCITT